MSQLCFLKMGIILLLFGVLLHGKYYPQCCVDPVNAFIMREFNGPCGCQSLSQKFDRYRDWIELNGGWINPGIRFGFVSQFYNKQKNKEINHEICYKESVFYLKRHCVDDGFSGMNGIFKSLGIDMTKYPYLSSKMGLNKDEETKLSNKHVNMYKHERGIFTSKNIEKSEVLFKIPFNVTFSEFLISKYIHNTTIFKQNGLKQIFKEPNFHLPKVCFLKYIDL